MINSYDPTAIKFHSYGHLTKWYDSPFAQQDPHLWSAVVTFLLISLGVAAYKFYPSRKKPSVEENLPSTAVDVLQAREQRLLAKIALLQEKIQQGTVGEAEGMSMLRRYQGDLEQVRQRLQQLKMGVGQCSEPNK